MRTTTGIVIVVYPTQTAADVILERSGSGVDWAALTTVIDPPTAGYAVTDILPLDNIEYAYRCKHVESGYTSSSYSTILSGTATSLPDVITGWPAPTSIPAGFDLVVGAGSLAASATSGFLYIPTVVAAPVGTPITYSDTVPMVYNIANNTLCIYRSGWKSCSLA